MEMDDLQSAWQGMATPQKSSSELQLMIQQGWHPVLKRIRKQLLIEIGGFSVFLFVYCDFFDGSQKPLYANIVLAASIVFAIAHNIVAYMLTKRSVKGDNIRQSLADYLGRIKAHAASSIVSRSLAAGGLLLFFSSVITFSAQKYWLLAVIIVVFIVQLGLLSTLWMRRIRRMKRAMDSIYE